MTIRSTYTLPAGTYTNFRTRFVETDVILSGNITFNGDTAIVCDTGVIDTSEATITVESGRTLVLAAETNTVTVGQITAPLGTVTLRAGAFDTERGAIRTKNAQTVAGGAYISPLISSFRLNVFGYYVRNTSTTMGPYNPIVVDSSKIAMNSPDNGVISRGNYSSTSGATYYRIIGSGFAGNVLYIIPNSQFSERLMLTDTEAQDLYKVVATTDTVYYDNIGILNAIKEFYSGGLGREAVITAINSRSGTTYDIQLGAGNLAIFGNSFLFVKDDFFPQGGYGYITNVFASSTTTRLVLDWYGPHDLFVGLTVAGEETQPNRALSRFYAGGVGVPAGTVGYPAPEGVSVPIPSSGTIRLSNFYGSKKNVITNITTVAFGNPEPNRSSASRSGGTFSWTVPPFIRSVRISAAGGGGGAAAGWGYGGNKSQGATAGGPGGGIRDLVFNVSPGDVIFGTIGNAGGATGWGGSYVVTYGGSGSSTDIYWRNNAAGGAETLVATCRSGATATGRNGSRGVLMALYPGVPGNSTIYYGSGQRLVGASGQVYVGYDNGYPSGNHYDPWSYVLDGGYSLSSFGTVAVQAPPELGGNYQRAGLGQVNGWVAIQYPASL